jgi:hypothetical protein
MLALFGAMPEGRKEQISFQTCMRETSPGWNELLIELQAHDVSIAPEVAIGCGAFWFSAKRPRRRSLFFDALRIEARLPRILAALLNKIQDARTSTAKDFRLIGSCHREARVVSARESKVIP